MESREIEKDIEESGFTKRFMLTIALCVSSGMGLFDIGGVFITNIQVVLAVLLVKDGIAERWGKDKLKILYIVTGILIGLNTILTFVIYILKGVSDIL